MSKNVISSIKISNNSLISPRAFFVVTSRAKYEKTAFNPLKSTQFRHPLSIKAQNRISNNELTKETKSQNHKKSSSLYSNILNTINFILICYIFYIRHTNNKKWKRILNFWEK